MRISYWWWGAVAIILAGAVVRAPLLILLGMLYALVLASSQLWARYCLAQVQYTRRFVNSRVDYGEETILEIEITNAKPLPLAWLTIRDEFPDGLHLVTGREDPSSRARRWLLTNMLSLRWYERVVRRYRILGQRRGAYQIGPIELLSGDVFGFWHRSEERPIEDELLVYPKLLDLHQLAVNSQRPLGDRAAPRQLLEDPLRLLGVREYVPGDSVRHIHWKASAHTLNLQTKVYEPSTSPTVLFFVNVTTFEHAYQGIDYEMQELVFSLTGAAAQLSLEAGYPTGLYVNTAAMGSGRLLRVRAGRHPAQFMQIMEVLARALPLQLVPFAGLLRESMVDLPYGATIIAVSAVADEEVVSALLDLHRRGHPVTLLALGEEPAYQNIPGVEIKYLGGRELWRTLERKPSAVDPIAR
ncbi:MAG: DUF58 domain-containing protein [Chloroflexi bacterium]|nr:DUF58 domain-containing protein [Chloroflexota bacterium]